MKTKVLKAVLTLLVFALGALVGCAPEDGIKNIRMSFETDGGTQIEAILQEEGTEITPPEDPVKNGYTFEYWCSDAELTQKYEFGVMPGQDITLYAKYKANEYTLTFEPNGGKIEGTYPEKYTFGQTLVLPVPEFDGFAFGGWYDNAELNGESITQISAETFGNQTYYAKWTPAVYEIKYELNGMVNHPDNPSTYTFGTRIVLHNAVSEDPTKGFFGWYLTPDFTGDPVTAIEDTSMGDITLYACVKEGVYSVTYELNDGENDARNPTYYESGKETLLYPASKEHYTFVGWYSGDTLYEDSIPATQSGPLTLTARWKAIEYTIHYDAVDGVLQDAPDSYTIETERTDLVYPFKSGYAFVEWQDAAGNAVTSYGGGTTGDISVTAVYKQAAGVAVGEDGAVYKFLPNDGYEIVIPDNAVKINDHIQGQNTAGETYAPTSLYIGPASRLEYIGNFAFNAMTSFASTTVNLPASLKYIGNYAFLNVKFDFTLPEDNSLEFIGNAAFEGTDWETKYLKPSKEAYFYFGKVLLKYKGDDTVVDDIRSDTVGIAGGAFQDCTTLTSIVIPESVRTLGDSVFKNCTSVSSIVIPSTVTMVFYDLFAGWTADQTVYLPFAEGEKPAGWDQNWSAGGTNATFVYTKYNIIYELDNGKNPEGTETQYTRGEEFILPKPTKVGYEFEGWYLTEDFSGEAITAISAGTLGSVTVYAKWTQVETIKYTLTLNADGGTLDIDQIVYDVSTEETALPYPLKAGYMFQKWVDKDGAEVTFYGGGMTGNKTLTAVYLKGEGYTLNENNEITGWERTSNNRIVIADDIQKICDNTTKPGNVTDAETEFYIGKNSRLTYIGDNAFAYMTFKNSRFDMPKTVKRIGVSALINCNFFIDFDEDLSALEYIGGAALDGTAWASQQLPNYTDNDVYIGNVYYLNRDQAAEVVIREGTVSIAGSAFMRTKNVTSVVIPASVKSIGNNAFGSFDGTHATGIKSITIPETVTMVSYDIFGSWTEDQTVYLPFAEGEKPADWDQNWASGNSKATFVYKNDQAD